MCNKVLVKDPITPKPIVNYRTCFRLLCFSDINISQVSELTCLRCGGIFYNKLLLRGARILKIGQNLAKLEAKILWHLLPDTVYKFVIVTKILQRHCHCRSAESF